MSSTYDAVFYKIFSAEGALVGGCIMGSIMVSNSAYNKRLEYKQCIKELDRWHQENAEAISFGQFYRENYPKKYREWQTDAGSSISPTVTFSSEPTHSIV